MSEKMREEFEAAYVAGLVERCGEGFRETALYSLSEKKPDGRYMHYTDWLAWWAWQASRESLVIELPNEATRDDFNDESLANGFNDGLEACRAAIEASGVKCK